ncbi:MAG: hypothetical protein LBS62_02115 [Clostridiales bacterium]|jgi:hypothetical protein|nr:hypothetical protein [Clostridiales bacterium]
MAKGNFVGMGKEFNEMTFAEKREHIWEYYRIHILGALAILALIVSFIYGTFINPPPETFAQFAFYGDFYVGEETLTNMRTYMDQRLALDTKKYVTQSFECYTAEGLDVEYSRAMMEKFFVMLAVSEIDIVITNKAGAEYLGEDEAFLKLSEILSPGELGSLEDKLYFDAAGDAAGIKLDGSRALADSGVDSADLIALAMVNSKRLDAAAEILRIFWE